METFSEIIENWYKDHARELPWRGIKDPYKIWISEIILQQTQVKQGYDYYLRFIHRFPDVRTLAEADEQEVLKFWQGLGYYSRARNILASARIIMSERAGIFPSDYKSIRALKGVGDYTAAAISSFAYGLPEAVLDGNVYRVLARYFAISTPIDTTVGKRLFNELSNTMLDRENPGLYNQAIMDFGALQCTPQNPDCLFCPLQASCAAFGEGNVCAYPVKARKTKVSDVWYTYLYIAQNEHFLLHRRTGNGIWKNMYELPLIESMSKAEHENILQSDTFYDWAKLTGTLHPVVKLITDDIKHVLSHRIIHAQCYMIKNMEESSSDYRNFSEKSQKHDCIVVTAEELKKYPLPRLITRILEKGGGIF